MQTIRSTQKELWNTIVKSFSNWDIYYLNEYAQSLMIHGDGQPILLYFESTDAKMAYVMMENDLSEQEWFKGQIYKGEYLDWTTPYGYGGPLFEGNVTEDWLIKCINQVKEYAKEKHIISQFFRFHPLLQNQSGMESVCNILPEKETIYIDTISEKQIYKNMTPNNRNMVRKAKKLGVQISYDNGERLDEFEYIYNKTMEMHHADKYYSFQPKYFQYLKERMKKNMIFFYAEYEGNIISSSIFFYNEHYMHYHLSGTLPEYRKMASANLLLTEAAYWASSQGIQKLHLGGGVSQEDSLFQFKKHFNRNGELKFYIGSNIFDEQKFKQLVDIRGKKDQYFDKNQKYMILYRA